MRSWILSFLIFMITPISIIVANEHDKLNSEYFIIDTKKWESSYDDKTRIWKDSNIAWAVKHEDGNIEVTFVKWNSKDRTEKLLTNIMTKLMIGISLVTGLLIVIGGGCLIFSGGSDGLKTKGKNILMAGILSLSVAMCSAIIINIVGYVLYGKVESTTTSTNPK